MRRSTLANRVARGESARTVVDLPLLTTATAACAPLWRLFNLDRPPRQVQRQIGALCARCGLHDTCTYPTTKERAWKLDS